MGITNITIDVSTYTYNTQEGATALFTALPSPFKGVCYASFANGLKAIVTANKTNNNYGSMTYTVDYDVEPYYYGKRNTSIVFDRIAMASKFTPQTGDLTTISTLTPIRADVAKYSVSGNVCTIFINNVQFDRSISSDTAILTCPIKPKYHTRFIMLDQSNNIMNSYVSANTGDIITTGYTSGKYMYGSVSFVIN